MVELEYRMYGLVPYNISKIQQAIQYGHAVQEYNNMMFEELFKEKWAQETKSPEFAAFQKWANVDKTFIILNGGTTNFRLVDEEVGKVHTGTLNNHLREIRENGIRHADFYEPDLGDQLTAVVFLADERVWNKEKYPDHDPNPQPDSVEISPGVYETPGVHLIPESMDSYKNRLGGEQNVWLREFLRQFRLA